MNFNLTIIRPQGFLHSSAFIEVRDSVGWALAELGHVAGNNENWFSNDPATTNIVFGAELLSGTQQLPSNTIIYNLEQPTHPQADKVNRLVRTQNLKVWSCFKDADSVHSQGRWFHVPIGYTPNLTRIPDQTANGDGVTLMEGVEVWDVLFYGWMTPRRKEIVERLRAAGLKVYASDALYGGGRDNLISRSKIVLNVHHDGRDLFEIVRVSYLMANSKCVVSEVSRDDAEYADLHRGLVLCSYDEIVEKCKDVLNRYRRYYDYQFKHLPRVALETIQRRDYVDYIRRALAGEAPEAKVARRYRDALAAGDMKDFAPRLKEMARGNILEIGVRDGASTAAFLAGLEERGSGRLFSIDILDCSSLFAGHPQWTFYQMDSRKYFQHAWEAPLPPRQYDVILIDGDHSRERFRQDLESAWGVIAPGGTILCHDIVTKDGWTLEEKPGSDLPSKFIRQEYLAFCGKLDIPHSEIEEWPGLGMITKPAGWGLQDSDESWQGSEALLGK